MHIETVILACLLVIFMGYEIYSYITHRRKVRKFDETMLANWGANSALQTQQSYRIVEIFASYRGSPISIKLTTPDAVDEVYLQKILQVLTPAQEMPIIPFSTKELS